MNKKLFTAMPPPLRGNMRPYHFGKKPYIVVYPVEKLSAVYSSTFHTGVVMKRSPVPSKSFNHNSGSPLFFFFSCAVNHTACSGGGTRGKPAAPLLSGL